MALHPVRASKTVCVALIGGFATLVALNNVLDYGSNFEFVRHVLSMDTTFEGNQLMYRAMTSPGLHHVAYWFIIALEAVCGIVSLTAAFYMARGTMGGTDATYQRGKSLAYLGLTTGFILWFGGFMVIGAEWFLMWQSEAWNGQDAAFMFSTSILGVLIYLSQAEDLAVD